MPPRYYCDYCDKQFHDTPASRKRHTQGSFHQRAKKAWFDSFKGTAQIGNPASTTPAVTAFGPPAGGNKPMRFLKFTLTKGPSNVLANCRRGRTYNQRKQVTTITAATTRRWLARSAMGGLGLVTLLLPDQNTALSITPYRNYAEIDWQARKISAVTFLGGQSMHLGGNRETERGGQMKKLVIKTQATKRQFWKEEPLVNTKMTKRAMRISKELREWMQNETGDGILLATLERWVASMNPVRRDWLDVLKEFDTSWSRELLFKLSEWSFNEEWFEVNNRDYAKLIERYGKAGRIEDAERLLEEMEARGFEVDMVVLTVMLGMFGKARFLERAIKVFDRIKSEGFEPDTMVYNTLMSAYGYCGHPWEAEQWLEVMNATSVPATVETFCGLINGYARAERADEAQRVFDVMLSRGIKPNTKAFTALLDAYGRVGDVEKARTVFERLRQIPAKKKGSLRQGGYVPDDRAICLLIAAYEKRGMLTEAVSVVVELETAGIRPGPDSMTGLIAWFGRVGLVEEAEELFLEMVERKMRITPRIGALMCNAYVKGGRLEKARDFTRDMKNIGIQFNNTSVVNFDPTPPVPQLA